MADTLPMKQKLRKDERLTFRLTADQKSKLQKLADKQGKKRTELIRDLVILEIGRQEAA